MANQPETSQLLVRQSILVQARHQQVHRERWQGTLPAFPEAAEHPSLERPARLERLVRLARLEHLVRRELHRSAAIVGRRVP